ncbi:DUF302 domain-containing protein [Citrobacter sp. C348]|uniref:DUF302 domain-containing protein n=1 Tax=Citrobacter sp. C348 TaxID=3048143 RepID=UPI0015E932E5|nr:DUF302 domain-containing protein [Citrobacter freundii]MBA7800484.1 DUF302 domain-containing protein [Citrobacter freundii]QMD26133.1 DUF302 domain-containing protein [Citrobacter freundii]WFW14508.1 DUF302 domain-containing protein [Citrobacter freundii]
MRKPKRTKTLPSKFDFDATVNRLVSLLNTKNIRIFAQIDQQQAAMEVGLTLRPTMLFLFGNPKGGTPAMQANPHAAIELPLRVVIWLDDNGITLIDYQDASSVLTSDYGIAQSVVAPVSTLATLLNEVAGS